jgi:outer membrane protein assembly factor BamB
MLPSVRQPILFAAAFPRGIGPAEKPTAGRIARPTKAIIFALVMYGMFACGCARLLNSGRPRYSGPLVKAVWHNAGVRVAAAPVIRDGVVYAIAQPWSEETRHLFAFDLRTGTQLWVTSFPAERLLLSAGPVVFVVDADGGIRPVDARTGQETGFAGAVPFLQGTFADGIIYVVSGDGAVRAIDRPAHTLWQAAVPLSSPSPPVVAGGVVYVYGSLHKDPPAPSLNGLYAFDAKTGAPQWKRETEDSTGQFEGLAAEPGAAYLDVLDQNRASGPRILIAIDAANGQEKWTHAASGCCPISPLLDRDAVVICDCPPGKEGRLATAGYVFRGLDRATGKPLWEAHTSWKYQRTTAYDGSLFVSDSKVHELLNEGGDTSPDSWLSKVDLRTGREVWRTEVIELGTLTAPAVGEGMVGGEGMVVAGSEPFTASPPHPSGKPGVAGLWAWRASQ